ncbi:MAG TPA: MerR family transcriptional regulator [Candidatus Babeliaceae bacterium]|nr:MerR family transcriptional regulator [Candidatus Babeliaceae bacterium]
MKSRSFRIGQLAEYLSIDQSVIRFWEKEFGIKGSRSRGGQRFYRDSDIKKFDTIKYLLYSQGFTITGAKKYLQEHKDLSKSANLQPSKVTTLSESTGSSVSVKRDSLLVTDNALLECQIRELKKKLVRLRELL